MAKPPTFSTVEEYIAQLPPETRKVLKQLRALIKSNAPRVTERISYAIPTFELNGRYLIYLAGWKKHISLYPVTAAMLKAFKKELEPYQTGKGTLQFPLDHPMPTDLIKRIVEVRVKELASEEKPSRSRK
jgi:uncharacterized protein YdhG (YjbR/CyaY superfamily)